MKKIPPVFHYVHRQCRGKGEGDKLYNCLASFLETFLDHSAGGGPKQSRGASLSLEDRYQSLGMWDWGGKRGA